ncbi:MAG: translocation/assembly module TamB domain-containing protein [Sulfurovum sp.]|nr:translocation/assembly module TamB domain-containing protein [Sulfurovum sp.]
MIFKKIFYSFLVFFVALIVIVVFAANSSWVIKKAADKFAPEYKISYDDIRGNVFTGVKILGLKFDGKTVTKKITFAWNPSKILYKRVAINEISVEDLDVDVVKALIDSFPASEDNSSSEPLPVIILVDKVHVSVNAFEEQGIRISKTVLDVEDLIYANDEIGIDFLSLKVDTNITNILLEASIDDGKLVIDTLDIENIDSDSLEKMFLTDNNDSNASKNEKVVKEEGTQEEMNPLIPKEVFLKKFVLSLKPRLYKSAKIVAVDIQVNNLQADIEKILSNGENSISVEKFSLLFDSNVTHLDLLGNLQADTLTLEEVNISDMNTLALQALFVSDKNISSTTEDKEVEEKNEVNHLVPKYVVLKSLSTEIMPASYDPVNITHLLLRVKDLTLDIQKLMVENGSIDLNGSTNFSNITYAGKIKDNQLLGSVVLRPHEALFTLYKLPVRREAIGDLTIDIDASEEHIILDIKAKAKQILVVKKLDDNISQAFNLDIDSLLSHVVYTLADNTLVADTKIMITTPYAEDVSVTNKFILDQNISYSGEVNVVKLIGIEAKFVKPLNNLMLKYTGNLDSLKTDISSDGLKGTFVSSDMKKGDFHIETIEAIGLDKMLTLPDELNGTKVNVVIDVPLDFAMTDPMTAKVKVSSNISNLDADITYDEILEAKVVVTIPKNSLLKNFDKNVKWNVLSPLVINAVLDENDVTLNLKSKALSSDIKYGLNDGKVLGQIRLAGLVIDVKGLAEEKIAISANVNAIESLMTSVQALYTVEGLPPVEGALNLSMDVINLEQVDLSLSSPKIIYHADRETEHIINDVKLLISADKSKVELKSYAVRYDEIKVFSTKPSLVKMKEENIEISELWINDQLKVVGKYNTKTKKGNISTDATKLHIAHEMIDMDLAIDIQTILNEDKTSINGKVILLGGDIHYDMSTKTYPSDSDILIVQDIKDEKASPFMDNLSMMLNVSTKKSLIYKKGPIDIKVKVNLSIHKAEHSELMVLGDVTIVKGGSYTFEGKKFVLDKSNIYFTGNPSKPLLDMSIKYKSLNHLITIGISGTPATPNITFSSVPSLGKEQILSIILFDSEEGAGTNSGEDMMKMMGGAMAKSALSNMGIQLDHLAIGSDGSIEVGKKITDKITFIYINDELPEVRIKYQHSSRLESVVSADEESSGYDIVYKRDFKSEDFIFSR